LLCLRGACAASKVNLAAIMGENEALIRQDCAVLSQLREPRASKDGWRGAFLEAPRGPGGGSDYARANSLLRASTILSASLPKSS
jgi:hypothetical protein